MYTSSVEALARGENKYLANKPCKHGHAPIRWAKGRQCVECASLNYAAYIAKRPGWLRDTNRKSRRRRLGISEPTRPEPQACELCGGPPNITKGRVFHLDHDPSTGCFRGWLCGKCNTALGCFGDNVAGLERAIAYLKRAQQ